MNFTLNDHPRLLRILTILLVVFCVNVAWNYFYYIASVPTDENVFITAPSSVFMNADVPAVFVEELEMKSFTSVADEPPNALLAGDAFIAVNKTKVKTLGDVRTLIDDPAARDTVEIFLLRSSVNKHLTYRVPKKALTPGVLTEYKNVVLVTSVLPGGASDRAGMKTGDIIYRINDQTFVDDLAADKILRQGEVDKSLRYDIHRNGTDLSLQVTLAKFGVTFTIIIFFCVGLFYMGTGTFIVLKRPRLIAARLLGWGFIALSCLFMSVSQGRQPDLVLLQYLRTFMILLGSFGGAALFAHSFFYFPVENTALLAKKRHRVIVYALSAVFCLAFVLTKNGWTFFGAFTSMWYVMIAAHVYKEKRDGNALPSIREAGVVKWMLTVVKRIPSMFWSKSMMSGVKGSLLIIALVTLMYTIFQKELGSYTVKVLNVVVLTFVLFPLAYLYTIGRYQLLDMSLRIRRNLQYSALTIVWNIIIFTGLVLVFFSLPDIVLPLQNVEFTGASILITDAPVSAADFLRSEKIGSMILGLVAVFGYLVIRRTGQKFIDEQYYQTQFDYRRALSELSEALAAKLGMEDLAHGLVTTLTDLLKVKHASVLFFRNEETCCCMESAGKEISAIRAFCIDDQSMLITALRSIKDFARVEYLPVKIRTLLEGMGIRIVLPIRSKEQLIGALLIGEKLSETAFKDEDISFLNSAAMQASISIENAFLYEELAEQERMKHELEIARKIQLASLPQELPKVRGLDIDGGSLPAMEVGGDFYDYLETDEHKVTVIIGDVSGKGTSAALYMSKVQGILRSLFTIGLTPRELFIRANKLLCRDLEKRSFVTVLGAEFDMAQRTVRIARAGHLPLFCYDATSKAIDKIVPPGMGLGLNDAEQPFSLLNETCRDLRTGDVYLFVSDGITEARNEHGDEFGDDRLCTFLEVHHGETPALLCEKLYAAVKAFAGAVPQHDDQTIVCIVVTKP
jgi:serine phosphatase RsbU (regulator of sigma subunit)